MHLLIVLLQQLLGMLPGAKKVLQPEVVRQGTPNPTGSEPDACLRLARSNQGWMTISQALSVFWGQSAGPRRQHPDAKAGPRPDCGPGSAPKVVFRSAKERTFAERKATLERPAAPRKATSDG